MHPRHNETGLKPAGAQADTDGKEAEALQMIQDNPALSNAKLSKKLKDAGIHRGPTWVGNKRFELAQNGGKVGTPSTTTL